jgi:hypothetical protein
MNRKCFYCSKELESDNNTNFCNEACESDYLYEELDDNDYGENQ